MIGFVSLTATLCAVLLANSASARLIDDFGNCPELNNYYINYAIPLVGPYGIFSFNAYANSRDTPREATKSRDKPGGPAGLKLRHPFPDPNTIQYGNLTKPNGNAANEADEGDTVPNETDEVDFVPNETDEVDFVPNETDEGDSAPSATYEGDTPTGEADEDDSADNDIDEEDSAVNDEGDPAADQDFSTTNVQVKDVDEPDIIKTDGKRVFTLSGNVFSTVEVLNDGAAGKRTGKLVLPTSPIEMLIEGDYILAIASEYNYKRPGYQRYVEDPSYGESSTVVYQIYVGRPQPRLLSTLELEGTYIKSREVDGVVRLVLRFDPFDSIYLYYPTGNVTAAQTEKWNREIIQYSRPENWLPTYRLKIGNRVQWSTYVSCGDVYHATNVFSGFKLLTVVTLQISGRLTPGSSATVISDAETIFATKDSLYVTTSEFRYADESDSSARWGANYQTAIHKFNLTNKGATYLASGSVTGSVINQFALNEYQGTFFIATTDGASWWNNRDLSRSKLTAFVPNEQTRVLRKIGEVRNLGVGERIYSVRYLGDTAYVVTFRETDPLYIIDLSDPTKLRVTGELKIPGFSSYLHPVAPGRIIGVGQEATLTGRTTGAKVSLFDVSDKTAPKEVSSWSLLGSYTDAQWDHRAFLYWSRERIAVMPVDVYYSSQSFSGAIVLDISETKITERGRIVHKVPGQSYSPSILRNVIIGGVHLWSMSYDLLQVNSVKKINKVEDQISIN